MDKEKKTIDPILKRVSDFQTYFQSKPMITEAKAISGFDTFTKNKNDILKKVKEEYGTTDYAALKDKLVGQSQEGVSFDDILFSHIRIMVETGVKNNTLKLNGDIKSLINAVVKQIKETGEEKKK